MNGGHDGNNGATLHGAGNLLVVERLAEVQRPTSTFTFIDDEAASMMSGAFWVEPGQTDYWWKVPGARDRGEGANVAFADGHVAYKPWRFTGRTRSTSAVPVRNQQDRADLAWVVNGVPSLREP
jgi:prepilin-type processing-associated H-X9-DG protein